MVEEQVKAGSGEAPELCFRDLEAAAPWLCTAFGFSEVARTTGDDGTLITVRLSCDGHTINLKRADAAAGNGPPSSSGEDEPQSYYLLVDNVDKIHRRAKAADVDIVFDNPAVTGGRRSFACRDIEGHIWFFGERIIELAAPAPVPRRPTSVSRYLAAACVFLVALAGLVVSLHVASKDPLLHTTKTSAAPPAITRPPAPHVRAHDRAASTDQQRASTQEPIAHETVGQAHGSRGDDQVLRQASKTVAHLHHELARERQRRAKAEQLKRDAEMRLRVLAERADRDAQQFVALEAKIKAEKSRQAALSEQLAELRSRLTEDFGLVSRHGNTSKIDAPSMRDTPKSPRIAKKRMPLDAEEVYARLERSAQVAPQPMTEPPRIAEKIKPAVRRKPWRRVAKQRSPLFGIESLTLKLQPADRLIRMRAMKHDVRVFSAEVVYANGHRRQLSLGGRIEDGYWTRTLSLGVTSAPVRRVRLQHQTTFNPEGPGWVEVWVR